MGEIAKAIGLVFVRDPAPLRLLELSDQHAELITDTGDKYRLPWWRCSLITTSAERMDRAETASAGERLVHPYSAIHDSSGRPLTIQVLSESLATVIDDGKSITQPNRILRIRIGLQRTLRIQWSAELD